MPLASVALISISAACCCQRCLCLVVLCPRAASQVFVREPMQVWRLAAHALHLLCIAGMRNFKVVSECPTTKWWSCKTAGERFEVTTSRSAAYCCKSRDKQQHPGQFGGEGEPEHTQQHSCKGMTIPAQVACSTDALEHLLCLLPNEIHIHWSEVLLGLPC
jgi:hypothetical protein